MIRIIFFLFPIFLFATTFNYNGCTIDVDDNKTPPNIEITGVYPGGFSSLSCSHYSTTRLFFNEDEYPIISIGGYKDNTPLLRYYYLFDDNEHLWQKLVYLTFKCKNGAYGTWCDECQSGYYKDKDTGECIENGKCSLKKFNNGNGNCSFVCSAGSIYFGWEGQNYCIFVDDNTLSTLTSIIKIFDFSHCQISVVSSEGINVAYVGCGNKSITFPYTPVDFSLVKAPSPKIKECGPDEELVIYEDGNVICVPKEENENNKNNENNRTKDSGNKDNDNNDSENSKDKGSGDNNSNDRDNGNNGDGNSNDDSKGQGNGDDKNNENNKCPDACVLAGTIGTESRVIGNCNIITKPVYPGCVLEYRYIGDKCIPECDSNRDGGDGSSDLNISGTLENISGKLSTVNANLKSINDNLNDIKNLQPDDKFGIGGDVDVDFSSFNNISNLVTNVKNNINALFKNIENLKSLLSNKPSVTFFSVSNTKTCPIDYEYHRKVITLDVCKVVSPFRSFISVLFTILFDLSIIFFFIKLILIKKDS